MPHTVAAWFKSFGYSDVKNVTNLLFTKDWDDVRDADRLYRAGYKVSLFISANTVKFHLRSIYRDGCMLTRYEPSTPGKRWALSANPAAASRSLQCPSCG